MANSILRSVCKAPEKVALRVWKPTVAGSAGFTPKPFSSLFNPELSMRLSEEYTYADVFRRAQRIAREIQHQWPSLVDGDDHASHSSFSGRIPPRVSILASEGIDFLSSILGVWLCSLVSVPLCVTHPPLELQHCVKQSNSKLIICSDRYHSFITDNKDVIIPDDRSSLLNLNDLELSDVRSSVPFAPSLVSSQMPYLDPCLPSLVIFTSGTTAKPKAALHTHGSLESCISSMQECWQWTNNDECLSVLPLHHVHGLVNVNLTALSSGATLSFIDSSSSEMTMTTKVKKLDKFEVMLASLLQCDNTNVFMAVPTIYHKMQQTLKKCVMKMDNKNKNQDEISEQIKNHFMNEYRLMVSGSSALPTPVFEEWSQLSGHRLLERYGMTEIQMALSNVYDPMSDRQPGTVGQPMPGVRTKMDDSGQLLINSPSLFNEYLEQPDKTIEEFEYEYSSSSSEDSGVTHTRWFKTGDIVEIDEHSGNYRILGRDSVDIIKQSGFKVSALEVERVLLEWDDLIEEVSVFGLNDEVTGEVITAIIKLKPAIDDDHSSTIITLSQIKQFCKDKMAHYKIPKKVIILSEAIPKNAMNKVNKKMLKSHILDGTLNHIIYQE